MTGEQIASERARTLERITALAREHDDIVESAALSPPDDEHDPEGATIAFERVQVATLLAEARAHLAELDRAAERLRDGTYGTCEVCGRPIDPERLEARPTARTCVDCGLARRSRPT